MTSLADLFIDIGSVQAVRKTVLRVAVALLGALCVIAASRWSPDVKLTIEWAGRALIIVCIVGRTWCSLYIGGRKTSQLVLTGPYSVSRNPLYVFSIIGAVGVGAQLGAVSVAILAGMVAWLVHIPVVIQEERLLLTSYGETYREYLARVPRFLPRFTMWKNVDFLEVRPQTVLVTFVDACFFLAAVPVAEICEHFQRTGVFPVMVRLP